MEDYYEYLDSNGVTTLYKLIKDDTVALINGYSVTINGITTNLDNHVNNTDIHTPISAIESMVDTKISGLVNSAPETLDTLKELSDALGNDPNFATTVANQIGTKANSVHNHVVNDITDFPTIPTKVSQLENDTGFVSGLTDVVDTKSNQTIGGVKTFTASPFVSNYAVTNGFFTKLNTIARNEVPSQIYHSAFRVFDKNSKTLGEYCVEKSTSGSSLLHMDVHTEDSEGNDIMESLYLNLSNDGSTVSFHPAKNNRTDLGMPHYKWAKIYSDDVVHTSGDETIAGSKTFTSILKVSQGTLQVGSDTGYNVTYSWSGNIVSKQPSGTFNISLPKANGTLAIDENVVHTSGNEYIGGTKKFTADITRKNTAVDIATTPTSDMYAHLNFTDKNDKSVAYIQYAQKSNCVDYIGLRVRDKNSNTWGVQLNTNKEFIPLGNNSYSLGSSSSKWANVYATTFNGNLKGNADTATKAVNSDYATTAGSANSVAWANVTGKPSIPTTPNAYVTATWRSWSNWYRKWSNGFIEMGGFTNCVNVGGNVVATNLPIAFSNTDYTLIVQATRGTGSGTSSRNDYCLPTTRSKTTTRFEVYDVYGYNFGSPKDNGGYNWYACGY